MKLKKFGLLLGSIAVCQLSGIIGSVFTISSIPTWYQGLNKPPFNPPNWIFGPVWTILYALLGIFLYLIINHKKASEKSTLLRIFWIQLFLNAIWTPLFFGAQLPSVAFFEIIALWVSIVYLIYKAFKINKTISFLLIPYLLWVSFASILNLSIWILN
jgi:tryptophan-rich sensory protein